MGSFSVLNNIPAVNGQNQLNFNNVNLAKTLNRLSSGKRINSGADDAAGLQIADSLRGNVMSLNQSIRNAADGISVLQIADGALEQITGMLHRMTTLATQAATGTVASQTGKKALNEEFAALASEITRLGSTVNFNGQKLFNTSGGFNAGIFVGDMANPDSYINIKIEQVNSTQVCVSGNIATSSTAATMLTNLTAGLTQVATMRGSLGATMNRLQSTINVLSTQSQNTLAAESAVRDANIAEEITNMTKYQILAQTGIAALAQANANSQNVLGLLR